MTTVVYRDGVMAGDTAVFDRGCYCGQATKIFRNPDGTLGGMCGYMGDVALFGDWLGSGDLSGPVVPPSFKDSDSEGLIVRPDGSVFWIGFGEKIVPISGDFHAIGSGFRIAMGALAAGVTAARAVQIAADLDENTRRPIMTLNLKD
jgi:hypothetical protein